MINFDYTSGDLSIALLFCLICNVCVCVCVCVCVLCVRAYVRACMCLCVRARLFTWRLKDAATHVLLSNYLSY